MTSKADTVEEYLASLPEVRRSAINAVRKVILANLPKGFEECMTYGMIGYVVPHRIYPAGYHCNPKLPLPLGGLASQKHHMSFYAMTAYGGSPTETWFRKAWQATGKKLDMGKCCVRFRKLEDVPLEVVGKLFARVSVREYIAQIEGIAAKRTRKRAKR